MAPLNAKLGLVIEAGLVKHHDGPELQQAQDDPSAPSMPPLEGWVSHLKPAASRLGRFSGTRDNTPKTKAEEGRSCRYTPTAATKCYLVGSPATFTSARVHSDACGPNGCHISHLEYPAICPCTSIYL